jgi:putative zinc finger/helix-turn-helix YgiT family protein
MTELCVICETGTAHEVVEDRTVLLNGALLSVKADRFMKCDSCGEEYFTDEQSRVHARTVNDARRRAEGLLTGEEIQTLRRALMLTQAELEEALGIARKTVVRWENGTAVQGKAVDDVLRLIALDPNNLRLLVRVRQGALTQIMEKKLAPQDDLYVSQLKQVVYAGLDRVTSELETEVSLDKVMGSVVEAIVEHRRERVARTAKNVLDEFKETATSAIEGLIPTTNRQRKPR